MLIDRPIAPPEVRCRWERKKKHTVGGSTLTNVDVCPDCKSWTANLPLYRYDVCSAKERRRSGQDDRRKHG